MIPFPLVGDHCPGISFFSVHVRLRPVRETCAAQVRPRRRAGEGGVTKG